MREREAVRLLTRHFLRRFLDNDLVSPSSDGHEGPAFVFAFLIMAGLWVSAGLIFKSLSTFDSPFGILLSALNDKYVGLAGSMIVMGLGTVLEWEALTLDRRDWAVLGPLPVSMRALVVAKIRALALFVGAFALAMNGIPTFLYPPLQGDNLLVGWLATLWLVIAHATTSLLACSFGFLALLALRETARAILGPRVFRAIGGLVQFAAVLTLTTALLVLAVSRPQVPQALGGDGPSVHLSPPMWFLGLYETLISPVVGSADAVAPSRRRQYWTLAENQRDRRIYLAHSATFRSLAWRAIAAICLLAVLCVSALALSRQRPAAPAPRQGALHRSLRDWTSRLANRYVVRHPTSQAAFYFTIQTLSRSVSHRTYVAGYLALGVALVVVTASAASPSGSGAPDGLPPSRLLAMQGVLSFFLLAGTVAVFRRPAELQGNWVFRLAWRGDWRRYQRGVRHAVAYGVLLPLLVLLVPFHSVLWGVKTATLHLLVGWLASLVFLEMLLLRFRKLPFTCSYSLKGTFKTRWPWYVAVFLVCTSALARVERLALETWPGIGLLVLGLLALLAGVGLCRTCLLRRSATPIFDDPPERAAQALGLSDDG